MPIEINARLLHRSVFLAGEAMHCEVTVSYVSNVNGPILDKTIEPNQTFLNHDHEANTNFKPTNTLHISGENKTGDSVIVAWASAQIHCQCNINENKVIVHMNNRLGQEHLVTDMDTSFMPSKGEKGHCVLSTKPKVIFCNLKVDNGQSRKFIYSDKIPKDAPPSYRGQCVRFAYKLTIGIGKLDGPTQLIRLPIRVLDCADILPNSVSAQPEDSKNNPFLDDERERERTLSLLDIFLGRLSYMVSRRSFNTYNIWSSRGSAGKFGLSKSCYRIGEVVCGSFDFSEAKVRCIKYIVILQSEEIVSKVCQRQGGKYKPTYTSHSKYEDCCYNCRHAQFTLPVPITATPEFTSKLVSVKWRLHFEFTTSLESDKVEHISDNQSTEQSNQSKETFSKQLKIESMMWDLPIRILPTNPIQIALMTQSLLADTVIL